MHIKKLRFSFFALIAVLCVLAIPALAANGKQVTGVEGSFCSPGGTFSDGTFHRQGNGSPCPTDGADFKKSTWACPGRTSDKDMLNIDCSNGGPKECVFIDNYSNINDKKDAFFVPLNTAYEWEQFRNKGNLPTGVEIHIGCPNMIVTDKDDNKFPAPNMRVPFGQDNVVDGKIESVSSNNKECIAQLQCQAPTQKVNGKTVPVESGCGTWTIISQTAACTPKQLYGLTFNGKACSKANKPAEFVMVLDASASMDQLLAGAQNGLRSLVAQYLVPRPDIPVTISAFGGDGYVNKRFDPSKQDCPYGRLFGPLAANANQINTLVDPVFATANTPIDTAIRYSAEFFQDSSKRRVMLVLSDGYETCYGDPQFAVEQLRAKGIEIYGIKYGNGDDVDAVNFFRAMNRYSPANSQDEITAAIEDVVKDVTESSCKPILRLYATGDTKGEPLYTIQSDQTVSVKKGTYDAVVDYCTGSQTFADQKVEADRSFDFNLNCAK
jgi:von Willebrand factor type A domain